MIRALAALLFSLSIPALAGAQGETTLLVRTDLNCKWKLDGKPMGLLKAEDSQVVLASAGKHVIEAATMDGVATMNLQVEVERTEKTVDIQLKRKDDQQVEAKEAESLEERSGVPQGLTWTDLSTGLMWNREDNGSDVNWAAATEYCSKLGVGGYNNWRLPTLKELQGIYDPTATAHYKFDYEAQHVVHVKGHIKITGWTWSSSPSTHPGRPWIMELDGLEPGDGFPASFDYSMRALCVRPEEKDRGYSSNEVPQI